MRSSRLTPREREAVTLLCTGGTHREIAHALGISIDGVAYLIREAKRRLNARTPAHLVYVAITSGEVMFFDSSARTNVISIESGAQPAPSEQAVGGARQVA